MRCEPGSTHSRQASTPSRIGPPSLVRSSLPSSRSRPRTGWGPAGPPASDASGSELVTNFHVIDEAFSNGAVAVDVRQGDRTIKGTIARVDRNDDLAIIHVAEVLPALETARYRPTLAQAVMVVGSPLGLGGSVSVGVVSGFRSPRQQRGTGRRRPRPRGRGGLRQVRRAGRRGAVPRDPGSDGLRHGGGVRSRL